MLVEQLMTRDVESCPPGATLAEAAAIMWRRDCGVVPVVDDEARVVGVVTDRDVCIALASRGRAAHQVLAGEVMSRPVHACTAVDDVEEALATMRRARVRRLPVLDSAGRLAGIISINDVILNARRGGGKRHVTRREAFRVMRAVSRPHGAPEPPHENEEAGPGGAEDNRAPAAEDAPGEGAGPRRGKLA